MRVTPKEFFEARGIFTLDEFALGRSRKTAHELLMRYVKQRVVCRLQRGLYQLNDGDFFDPILAASKVAPDAVLAYDTALRLHEVGNQVPWLRAERISVLTCARRSSFRYLDPDHGIPIHPMHPPEVLGTTWTWMVEERAHGNHFVRVTRLERTLVDVLDRISLAPDARTLWAWFAHRALDVDALVHWARKLKSPLVAARLAFLLEYLPWASPAQIQRLPRLSHVAYFDPARRARPAYHRTWKLVVPLRLWLMAERTDFRDTPARIPPDAELPSDDFTGFQF